MSMYSIVCTSHLNTSKQQAKFLHSALLDHSHEPSDLNYLTSHHIPDPRLDHLRMTVKYEKNPAKENIEWCESCIPAGLHKTSLLKQIKTKKKKKQDREYRT